MVAHEVVHDCGVMAHEVVRDGVVADGDIQVLVLDCGELGLKDVDGPTIKSYN